MTSQAVIEISAAPREVFDAICEFADPPSLSRVSRPRGPFGPGEICEARSRALGRRFTHVFAVHRWAPPEQVEFRSFGRPPFAFCVAYTLTPIGEATRVEMTLTVTSRGVWRVADPLVQPMLNRISRDALQRLRRTSESRPATRAPSGPKLDEPLNA